MAKCSFYNEQDNRCDLAGKDLETWSPNYHGDDGEVMTDEDGEQRMVGGFQLYEFCLDNVEGCELLRRHPRLTKKATEGSA